MHVYYKKRNLADTHCFLHLQKLKVQCSALKKGSVIFFVSTLLFLQWIYHLWKPFWNRVWTGSVLLHRGGGKRETCRSCFPFFQGNLNKETLSATLTPPPTWCCIYFMLLLSARAHGPVCGDCGFSMFGLVRKGKAGSNSWERSDCVSWSRSFCFKAPPVVTPRCVLFAMWFNPTTSASSRGI